MPVNMKRLIADTFVSMAKQKGIDKITVTSLIEMCHISRQTFYYHFQDIMDVIEWTMEQSVQKTLDRSMEAKTPEEALICLISSAVENRTLILKLLDSQKRQQIEKIFIRATRTYLQNLTRKRSVKSSLSYSEREISLDFWACGISGLIFTCCRQDHCEPEDIRRVAKQICRFLPSNTTSTTG